MNQMIPKQPKSVEARLDHLESVLPLLVRLEEYLKTKERSIQNEKINADLDVSLRYSKCAVIDLEKQISDFKSGLDSTQKYARSGIFSLENRIGKNESALSEQSKSCASASSIMVDAQAKIHDLQTKLSNLVSLANLEETKKELLKIINDVLKDFHSYKNAFQVYSSESNKKLEAISSKLASHDKHIDFSNSSFLECEKNRVELSDKIAKNAQQASDSLSSLEKEIKSYIKEQIQSIRIPKDPIPEEQVRQWINDQIQLISLDAKNAIAKSNNIDMKATILEKKVENLSLALKSFELANKG